MKSKKTPSKLIIKIIKDILTKKRIVVTLRELHFLVNKELKKQSFSYSISPNRVKKLVLEIPDIKVKTKKRRDKKRQILKKCPVCNNEIIKIFGKNVFGKKIQIGYNCKRCGYSADLLSTIPKEYIFFLKKMKNFI